jgi:hypothetical protein
VIARRPPNWAAFGFMADLDGAVHSWKFCVPVGSWPSSGHGYGSPCAFAGQVVMGESAGNPVAGRAQHRWSFSGAAWSVSGAMTPAFSIISTALRTGATGRCSIPAGTLNGGVDDGKPGMYMAGRGWAFAVGGLLW